MEGGWSWAHWEERAAYAAHERDEREDAARPPKYDVRQVRRCEWPDNGTDQCAAACQPNVVSANLK